MSSKLSKRCFTIRFPNGDNDVTVKLTNGSLVRDLINQLRHDKNWSESKNIRLFSAGQELLPHNCTDKIGGDTLHCSVSDKPPSMTRQVPDTTVQESSDWVRTRKIVY
eukprot:g1154.t1